MLTTNHPGRACYALLLLIAVQLTPWAWAEDDSTPAQQLARTPSKSRIFVRELEGTWIAKPYLEALKASRAPHAAARKTPALAIKIQREGQSYPILTTNFQSAVLQFLLDVEPALKPGAYRLVTAPEDRAISSSEVTYINFRASRGAGDKVEELAIAEPKFARGKYVTFVRLPDTLDVTVNRLVIAGRYKDEQGSAYEFTESGDAVLPDRKFAYEISLDPRSAPCELLQSHREREPQGSERIGFDWRDATLRLFAVKPAGKDRYSCEAKPFAVLTPA
ncbi:MAG: hypothetical protein C5B46_07965 [Proteobacteria bacterium]|nr:MAG: hypothetical protein C5B46_07965 [Pseudomonadota bacterium]